MILNSQDSKRESEDIYGYLEGSVLDRGDIKYLSHGRAPNDDNEDTNDSDDATDRNEHEMSSNLNLIHIPMSQL